MTAYFPAYRLTVYAPRGVDPTEATVLTPAAGAAHNNPFQIATIKGVTNFQPYMGPPKGRRGKYEPLTKKSDIGALQVPFLDARVTPGGDNLTRWFSAFAGDAKGRVQLLGCKVKIEESLIVNADGTRTDWVNFYTGVLDSLELDNAIWVGAGIRDRSEDLKIRCFIGRPHSSISYSSQTLILPAGISTAYGSFPIATQLSGKVTSVFAIGQDVFPFGNRGCCVITLDGPSVGRLDNVATDSLPNQFVQSVDFLWVDSGDGNGTVYMDRNRRVAVQDTTGAWGPKDFYFLNCLTGTRHDGGTNVIRIAIATLDGLDPNFHAAPAVNDLVKFMVYWADATPTTKNPIFVNDQHVCQVWKDVLDGKFGYIYQQGDIIPTGKNIGDVKRTIPYDAAAFTTLIADTSIPKARFVINAPILINDFIEKYICQPFNLGYRLDESGQVVPFDARLPTSLAGILTITDADLVGGQEPQWSIDRQSAITQIQVKYYEDESQVVARLAGGTPAPGLVQITEQLYIDAALGRLDLGDVSFSIDALGLRYTTGESVNGHARRAYILSEIQKQISQLRLMFGAAAMEVSLPCRRTANTDAKIGDWRFLAVSKLLDPSLNKRGGTRLMRCVGRVEDKDVRNLDFIDAGPNAVAAQPSAVSVAGYTFPGDGAPSLHAVQVSITLTQRAVLQAAVTPTSAGSPPAATSPLWGYNRVFTASGTAQISGLPFNSKVWVRARTEPVATDAPQIPSDWLVNNTPATLADPGAPTGLTQSGLTGQQVTYSWTNAVTNATIAIGLCTPSGGTTVQVARLSAGSKSFTVRGTTPGSTYKIEVYYIDGSGGEGSRVSATWTAAGGVAAAPNMGALTIIQGSP